jgi:uncharacterized protein YjbI with pentapeptide repeats
MLYKTKVILLIALLASGNAYANLKYNQAQLQQFSQTNQCPKCDLSGAILYYGIVTNHSNCILTNANLTTASGGAMIFSNCDFSGSNDASTDYSMSNLSYADFTNSDLTGTNFSNAILTNANFSGAIVTNASFVAANLYQANITTSQLATAASVCGAILPDGSKGACH